MEENAIIVKNVSKTFKLPHERHSSFKSRLVNLHKLKGGFENQQVLKNISFEIKKGEFFGIVGRNGSGKSTLLKLIAQIYTPNSGSIAINGRLVPFIELGVGFNPELTGRENVYLNGALFGFSRREITNMYDEIVNFAELEMFMDQKLKNYSSGMQVRLAFSIAIRAKGNILLLDEVLAVGDAAFQTKCFDYFEKLKESNTTVIFVSHDKNSLERFCDNGVLIDEGKIVKTGPIDEVLSSYSRIVLDEIERNDQREQGLAKKRVDISTYVKIMETKTFYGSKPQKKFLPGEVVTVSFTAKVSKKVQNPVFGITVWAKNVNKPIYATNTIIDGNEKTGTYQKNEKITFQVKLPDTLNNGEYYIEPAVANESATIFYDQIPKASTFYVMGGKNPYSILSSEEKSELKRTGK